jgi:hypothetical protein
MSLPMTGVNTESYVSIVEGLHPGSTQLTRHDVLIDNADTVPL